jgi:hypothetical protein
MAGRIVLGSLLAALAMMIWGFLFWVVLPFGTIAVSNIPNEEAVRSALSQNLPASGAYGLPRPDDKTADPAMATAAAHEKYKAGPVGLILFQKEGSDPMAPLRFVTGFIYHFVSVLLAGILLSLALPALPTFGQRVLFVTLAGVFAAFSIYSLWINWWSLPPLFAVISGVDALVLWLIAGLILAKAVEAGGFKMRAPTGLFAGASARSAYLFMPPVHIRRRR